MRLSLSSVSCVLIALLAGCGPRVKTPQMVSFEQQKIDQGTFERLQRHAPDLINEALKYYARGVEEHEDNEPEMSSYYIKLAQITWQTAERRTMYLEHQSKVAGFQQRLTAAQALLNDALAKKTELNEMKTKQAAHLQAQAVAQQASKSAQDQAQAQQVELALQEARQKRDEAVQMKAPDLVPGAYKKGEMALRSAEAAVQRGDFINGERIARGAQADFSKAVEDARPLYEAEQARVAQDERIKTLLREASQISGADAVMEMRGVVVTLRGSFKRGKLTPLGRSMLGELTELISRYDDLRLVVEGHTTSFGKREQKLSSSEAMANQVKQAILARSPSVKITALGRGDYAPIDSNPKSAVNERVDIVFFRPRSPR